MEDKMLEYIFTIIFMCFTLSSYLFFFIIFLFKSVDAILYSIYFLRLLDSTKTDKNAAKPINDLSFNLPFLLFDDAIC